MNRHGRVVAGYPSATSSSVNVIVFLRDVPISSLKRSAEDHDQDTEASMLKRRGYWLKRLVSWSRTGRCSFRLLSAILRIQLSSLLEFAGARS